MNRKERRAKSRMLPARPSPADVPAWFARAARHHAAGRVADAERLYRDILAVAPRHADSLHRLGVILHQQGRHAAAAELLRKAVAENADAAPYHAHLGLVLAALGRLDDAIACCRTAVALDPGLADAHNNMGVMLARLGRLAEAAACYRRALVCAPALADIHNNLGSALLGLGRPAEAVPHFREALARAPDFADAHNNLGNALLDLGCAEEAEARYRQAIAFAPDFAEAHNNLGGLLRAKGALAAAMDCFGRASRIAPGHAEALTNLALTRAALGDGAGALDAVIRALAVRETPEGRRAFVACVRDAPPTAEAARLRPLLLRALREGWDRPDDLARAAAGCVRHDLGDGMDVAALAGDPLLEVLLCVTPNLDIALEARLAAARRELLRSARDHADTRFLAFFCALARQCFLNDYVFARDDDEDVQAQWLRDDLAAALERGAPVHPLRIAAVAAYFPLHAVPSAERLLESAWPQAVEALLTQQIREPAEELRLRESIPRLTQIEDPVSRQVRAQYEENPYPRWIACGTAVPEPLVTCLRRQFPFAAIEYPADDGVDILVVGCGTGRNAVETAQRFTGARVLAVDLSMTSLAHAVRKSRARPGLAIEYAQADLLALGGIDRRFDVIEAVGVLHHLADPPAGWRSLLPLLKPRGFMSVGLYSAAARLDLAEARAAIAEDGFSGATPAEIRRARRYLMERADRHGAVLERPDFFTVSTCRDLLFHAREQCFTLAGIDAFLRDHGLTFLGFSLPDAVHAAYRRRFPHDRAMSDLHQWHTFEQECPDIFSGMYQFWVQGS